jgi:hypothetical protein
LKNLSQEEIKEIVCYGIGDISSDSRVQDQFILLILLKEDLKISNVSIFDPVLEFVVEEIKETLEFYKITLIDQNEECKRLVSTKTLFYMPHCEQWMYFNVLLTNKCQLKDFLIIGNPLSFFENNEKIILPKCVEEKLLVDRRNFSFNDTSILRFQE